jgi:uncharacterized membrane protein YozB (DUF420 family)
MKELLARPGFLAPSGTVGADVSYLLAVVFTVLFLVAWRHAKRGLGTRHHKLILLSMVSMVLYFCGYYYARQLGVLSLESKEGFGGPESIYNNVFVPILTTHLTLVTIGLVMAIYMLFQGFRASEKTGGEYRLKPEPLRVRPKAFKTVFLIILGLWVLFVALRFGSMGKVIAWTLIFATVAAVVSLEKLIEKMLPDGARRHRVLGRGTMVVYALILATSTATYLMLYVIYPAK